jgi:ATP-dependent helicase/nuclease subunit A
MTTARDRATTAQRTASDPSVSAFVAASAGSGKTKLLTDRLLRLMLAGAEPSRIQCLTFTKAAAAEMALRLQRVLGRWVTLDDAALARELDEIGVAATAETMATARALFAVVLDLPGGMRIGTIHAFCQSLLRRFPLEAELSPHFELVDERDTAIAWQSARETMLARTHTPERRAALEALAGITTLDGFGGLVQTLQRDRAGLAAVTELGAERLEARLRRVLGARAPGQLGPHVRWRGEADLRRLFAAVAASGSPAVKERAGRILAWLDLDDDLRTEHWRCWCEEFQTSTGEDRKLGGFVNPKLATALPDAAALVEAEQARIRLVEDGWRAAEVARLTAALVDLAGPVTQLYAEGKSFTGRLDYDDLIARTARLLIDPGAAWVLFKLDGGLDHLLLDEVQDTAPAQWDIAGRLTAEFFAGEGARDGVTRTVFAVGDRKQSIYGFQGADPDAFAHWRDVLRNRVQQAGAAWRDVQLDVSFRSTAPVLGLVDAVFAQPQAARGVTEPGALRHIADRAGHAGVVELWPVTPKPEPAAVEPWDIPTENLRQTSAMQRLADALAEWIAGQIRDGVMLESKNRPLAAGDILVLVRRRNAFMSALVRALKARDVKVAGLDRMVLTEQPAVADLMALCDALLLPQDDLALACVLTSPLGGLTDDQLMQLAMGREGRLIEALRASDAPECRAAHAFFTALFRRVDHAAPHALLSEALGPLGGRARLLARLGPEAAEPIDELLAASLRHAQTHASSLQGFLHWLRQSAAEVKREAEGPGGDGFDAVRIMTVHGAKGLQAPLVILPDTTALPPEDERVLWLADADGDAATADGGAATAKSGAGLPVWTPRSALSCQAVDRVRAAALARQAEEQNRLLYVALTRAEDRLLVCGWETGSAMPETCWYQHVARGFAALASTAEPFAAIADPWPGELWRLASPQLAAAEHARPRSVEAPAPLPRWAGGSPLWQAAPPPAEPPLPQPLAPSRPEGVALGDVPQVASPLLQRDAGGRRFRRGQLLHTLLQHLPEVPPAERLAAALRFLDRPGQNIDDPEALAREVLAVLDDPALAPLFGPAGRAEVPLSGVVAGQVIGGLIDRLAILPDRVMIADYKTNRAPPASAEETPVLYLRQMAAYRAVLQAIHPGLPVVCLLVWTVGARVMRLPEALLDTHAPAARRVA